jgi:hypothetical protein
MRSLTYRDTLEPVPIGSYSLADRGELACPNSGDTGTRATACRLTMAGGFLSGFGHSAQPGPSVSVLLKNSA